MTRRTNDLLIILGALAAMLVWMAAIGYSQPPAALPTQPNGHQPNLGAVPVSKPIPVGAVLVSRNWAPSENRSPGWLNHTCTYIGDGTIVESQPGKGVQRITWAEYRSRPQWAWVLLPPTPEAGQLAAARAVSQVGTPYRRLSSVLPILERYGMNCISEVNDAYTIAGRRPGMRRPDDALRCFYYGGPVQ